MSGGGGEYLAWYFIPFTVNQYPAGTTYCLRAGVHSVSSSATPKRGDTFVGEYGAILDGTGWSTTMTRSPCSGRTTRISTTSPSGIS